MDEDWQDDLWEYNQDTLYDEDEGEEREEEDPDTDTFVDEVEDRGDEDDIEFAPDYKQLQQVSYERRSALGTVGLSEGLQKAQRTPEEATLDQVEGVISSLYSEISITLRQRVISVIEKIKGVYLYNVDTLVLAAIWTVEGKELTKKNVQEFMVKYKDRTEINPLDLIRYIRTISSK